MLSMATNRIFRKMLNTQKSHSMTNKKDPNNKTTSLRLAIVQVIRAHNGLQMLKQTIICCRIGNPHNLNQNLVDL